jgi:ABC-type polysaccharide/polyol phosphate transport system ATPase subunit
MSTAIELVGVGKRYQKLDERAALLRSLLPFSGATRNDFRALRDINLRVEHGECLGVIGPNGAGKTTLLRLLAGVTQPSEGRVDVRGRIAPLITLGVGFHPEMSGRENAVVNGMLLGLSAAQARSRLEHIIEFAELSEAIDTPVKFYSSGMSMRLGFSVIMHTEPRVLLIDEILAVGDAGFQYKCFDRLRMFREAGAAIVMVSHSTDMLRQLSRRGILLRKGRVQYDGDIEQAIGLHCAQMSTEDDDPSTPHTVVDVVERTLSGAGGDGHHASYDSQMELSLRLRFYRQLTDCRVEFTVAESGLRIATHTEALPADAAPFLPGQEMPVRIRFRARLGGGNYELSVRILGPDGEVLGTTEGLILFVAGRPDSMGAVDLRASIAVDGVNRTDFRESLLIGDEQTHRP